MRFAVAHKAATYLMVACAYIAMIIGGGVSPLIALGGAIGLCGSWWWEPPLVKLERFTWLWTTASLFALVYSVLTAVVTGDFLGIGAQFLIWLVVAKSYNRRAARDWQQIYLLAFLMLVAGSVLNADLSYGLCFLGFVIAATWALTLFHLRREMEDNLLVKHAADRASERVEVRRILDSKRIVGGRFFLGTGVLSVAVFLGAAILFLALPRVGFGFFLKARGGLTFSGFSDGVRLGGHGAIKNDSTIVMRVEVDSAVGGRDAPEIHWRGAAFDLYDHGRWTRALRAPITADVQDQPRPGIERHRVAWTGGNPAPADVLEQTLVRQEVWLEPFDTDALFGASTPYVFDLASSLRPRPHRYPRNDELRVDHPSTIHYTVYSQLAPPPPDVLRRAHGILPHSFDVYVQLPDDQITPRTRALAAKITAGLDNNYDKAIAIQRWLDANLSYTLELTEPTGDPVDYFLFERKAGHCEYFASAFAILARIEGIPVREVNGFLGGEWNEYEGYVAVRAGDAHAWDEVYFPGAGWVTFDPTPPDRHDPLGRGGTGWTSKLSRFVDTLRFQWTKWVIEYDLVSQLSLFKDLGGAIKRGAGGLRDLIARLWPILLPLVALAIAIGWWRRRRRPRDPT
ncbi:MAG TPA: transglutaminaseTgpA domain-containing protein, partial [Kofleriaceae bacterium]|nr:transglutaminaseTgpA domain-containing protein [Kofleriaceae bacterium]